MMKYASALEMIKIPHWIFNRFFVKRIRSTLSLSLIKWSWWPCGLLITIRVHTIYMFLTFYMLLHFKLSAWYHHQDFFTVILISSMSCSDLPVPPAQCRLITPIHFLQNILNTAGRSAVCLHDQLFHWLQQYHWSIRQWPRVCPYVWR
jgi:hypothetical protein